MKYKDIILAIMCAVAGEASANTADFSFASVDQVNTYTGTEKKEIYNVAIHLDGSIFGGLSVTGLDVPLTEMDGISGMYGFLTSELNSERIDGVRVNIADIVTEEASHDGGTLSCVFKEPYVVPKEGVYVGYTFAIESNETEEQKNPVAVTQGIDEDGLYLMSSRTYMRWSSYSERLCYVSSMSVHMAGDIHDVGAALNLQDVTYVKGKEKSFDYTFGLINLGTDPIENIGYTLEIDGQKMESVYSFPQPVTPQYGHVMNVTIPVEYEIMNGDYPISFGIERINGKENQVAMKSGEAILSAVTRVPVHKPLMEEFTGLWCSWCPRGFAALERMKKLYPDTFVGVAYHNDDPMETCIDFPVEVDHYPLAWLDRSLALDPYLGTKSAGFGIEYDWLSRAGRFTPADVTLESYVDAKDDHRIMVKADVMFVKPVEGDYKMIFLLLSDGLTNSEWLQKNIYSGEAGYEVEEMDVFVNGDTNVSGLVFNDVLICYSDLKGIEGSLPEEIVPDVEYTWEYTFDITDAMEKGLVVSSDKLRAVAAVVNSSTGEIINCNESKVSDVSGTERIEASEIVSTEFYDLYGRKINNPQNGLCIEVVRYSNGSIKSKTKMLF